MLTIMDWRRTITDPNERKVLEALALPGYTWRTVGGVSRHTGLSQEDVELILRRYVPNVTRFSPCPSISGSPLVGLVERVGV